MFSSKSDNWATPQSFFDKLDKEFNFDCDVCATSENAKCNVFISPEMNGLVSVWGKVNWCNPPYSRVSDWVKRAYWDMLDYGNTTVMLIPSRTDTRYYHDYIWNEATDNWRLGVRGRFIKGRLKFGDSKNSAPFPSMLVIFKP